MAILPIINARIVADGFDLSGDSNKGALEVAGAILDATNFRGDGYKANRVGQLSAGVVANGFANYGDDENENLFSTIGDNSRVCIAPDGLDEGDIAYFFQSVHAKYEQFGAVADLAPFAFEAAGRGRVVRGVVMVGEGSKSASGSATARLVGAATLDQRLYCGVFAFDGSGTLDVTVKSDDALGMASPTTRATFAQLTGRGSEIVTVDGPITDTYYDVDYTITGAGFNFVVVIGIEAIR